MKKIIYLAFALTCFAYTANAAVSFLPQASDAGNIVSKKKTTNQNYTAQDCIKNNYTKTSCPSNQVGRIACPNNSSYFKFCCDAKYQFTIQECKKYGLRYSTTSCAGLYECY